MTTIAPTILITNASGPFLTLQGNIGSGVTDLLFHYPNQVRTSAAAPNVYPYTILVNNSGKVVRYMVTNAYNFLDIEIGRVWAQDLFIGAFNTGVNVDNANDHVTLRNVLNQVFWDFSENVTYPSTIDAWVLNHGSALVVGVAADLVGPLSVRWATAMRNREGQYRGESRATYHGFVSLQRGP